MDPEKYIDEITDSIMLEVEHGAFHVSSKYVPHNETKKIQENANHDIAIKNAQIIALLEEALDLYSRNVKKIYNNQNVMTEAEIKGLVKQFQELKALFRSMRAMNESARILGRGRENECNE
jgi:hypothetical protein